MKRILSILLLLPVFSYGQISMSNLLTFGPNYCSGCTGGHGGGNTQTFTKGKIYIAITASAGFAPASVAAGPNAFTLVSQVTVGSRYLGLYVYAPLSTHTGAFWFEYSPNGSCYDYGKGYEISGVPSGSNGIVAIKQVVTNSGTSADPSITLSALSSGNAVMAFFINSSGDFTGSPESPFTELWDEGCVTYPISTYGMRNISGSDNTPSFTAASSTWAGIAIELRSGRKVAVIN